MSDLYSRRRFLETGGLALAGLAMPGTPRRSLIVAPPRDADLLYVTVPGIRNYTEWGGVGVLVYDIRDNFKLLRRIPTFPIVLGQEAEPMKGVCASARTGRLYASTTRRMICLDLNAESIVWDRDYTGGCDRMAITPDGSTLYLPSFEGAFWHVVDAATGEERTRIQTDSGAHNTVCGLDGREVYLAGLHSPLLSVVDTATNRVVRTVGPFGNSIRPFTINGAQTRCYVNVNDLLGFEIGDLRTGMLLQRVEVPGFEKGPVKRHGCPSHGIGLTPDERQLWLSDGPNSSVHVFDLTAATPRLIDSIVLRDQPGWVTFTLDGRFAVPSTGEIIDTRTRRIVAALRDEADGPVQSEKVVEVVWSGGKPVQEGDQFGVGRNR